MDALRKEWEKQKAEQARAGNLWNNQFNLVFTDALGKNLVRRTVVKHFKKIAQRAGLADDARFHNLRHSFAVTSLYAGDDIKTVQANLGHATAQFTLDVYGHVTQKMRQESANRMQKFYENLSDDDSNKGKPKGNSGSNMQLLNKIGEKNQENKRKLLIIITITESFLAGALGLELPERSGFFNHCS